MLRKILAAALIGLSMTILAACQITISPVENPITTPNENDRNNTLAAQTIAVLGTEIAGGQEETIAPVIWPSSTPTFTPTPRPTVTPIATLSADCNQATFLGDVTIPDGSTILPNSTFTKTWELRNDGSCSWNSNYAVVFAGKGTAMNGPASIAFITSGEVKPGENARVSVDLRAPVEPGDYEGYWMLRTGNNQVFGLGPNGSAPFFVKIHVAEEYSFAQHLCSAQWSSSSANLPCPGKDGDSAGFVLPLQNPTMEDNKQREGLGWLAMPQPAANGWIVGKFPAVVVPGQSDFRATLSCAPVASGTSGSHGCYIHFKVTYRVDNGEEQVLGEWNEGYEGGVTEVVKDLNMVGGRSTSFSFYVTVSGGTPEESKGIWFNPRIIKN